MYTLPPTQCRLNVGPAIIHSTPGRASFCWLGARDYNVQCIHDTPTQYRLTVGPTSVTWVQPEPALYHNACPPGGSYAVQVAQSSVGTKAETLNQGWVNVGDVNCTGPEET